MMITRLPDQSFGELVAETVFLNDYQCCGCSHRWGCVISKSRSAACPQCGQITQSYSWEELETPPEFEPSFENRVYRFPIFRQLSTQMLNLHLVKNQFALPVIVAGTIITAMPTTEFEEWCEALSEPPSFRLDTLHGEVNGYLIVHAYGLLEFGTDADMMLFKLRCL
jgi:hypothetical protein